MIYDFTLTRMSFSSIDITGFKKTLVCVFLMTTKATCTDVKKNKNKKTQLQSVCNFKTLKATVAAFMRATAEL